ncbi:unnamed protein product [Vitrella brassicaformis CCMP3155]|uniref:Uncharacterized protein n=1 Tax=Vitrella brassicaformis (strain CCMP3155) TaxID=1169540 RepID=A0A0G4G3P8_VITBC|nr:unnamed protein product [Vitrella brassicaformis CCMP3155]|eukprot:CEM22785.1 unnamed protein product [Vitrella brassicaformis CCMP3155]
MPPSLLPGASLVWLAVGHPRYTRGDKRKCLNNYAYRLATALTLGITFPLASLAPSCPCGAGIDTLGDHFFLCSRATAERVFKHNTLLDVFKAILAEVGITAVTEVPLRSLNITPPNAQPNSQRMDLFFSINGEGVLCDITVVHPCRPENSTAHHTQVNRSNARRPGGFAAAGAERDKDRKYGANCRQKGYTFVPLAAETFGRWGGETLTLLRRLAQRRVLPPASSAEDRAFFHEGVMNHWGQCLSVALMRWNAFQRAGAYLGSVAVTVGDVWDRFHGQP